MYTFFKHGDFGDLGDVGDAGDLFGGFFKHFIRVYKNSLLEMLETLKSYWTNTALMRFVLR